MRIAIWHDAPPGGARRVLDALTTQLAAEHDVTLFHCSDIRKEADARALGARTEVIPVRRRQHVRGALYYNDWLTYRDLKDRDRLECEIAARIDGGGFDVALLSVLRDGLAPSALRYLRLPTVYYCHEAPRRFYEPWCRPEAGPATWYERARRTWRWPARRLLDEIERRTDISNVRSAQLILTNSRYTRDRVDAVYGTPAHVCYPGVDLDCFRPAPEPPIGTRVLSIGSLEPHKGFDFLIRALGRIPDERRPALTLVGSGGHPRMPAYLRDLARRLRVKLELLVGVSDHELVRLYQTHALFVFGARFEPLGLVALEALACGLPVIAVAEGGVTEVLQHGRNAYLVERDELAFAAAVDLILSNRTLRLEMRSAAAVDASEWSWKAAASRLVSYLQSARPEVRPAAVGLA